MNFGQNLPGLTCPKLSLTTELHAGRLVEEDSKKAKQRAQTVVVGDMKPLLSALPTIIVPELVKGAKSTNKGYC